MFREKRLKTDELQEDLPLGHPRPCAGGSQEPRDAGRRQTAPLVHERHGEKE